MQNDLGNVGLSTSAFSNRIWNRYQPYPVTSNVTLEKFTNLFDSQFLENRDSYHTYLIELSKIWLVLHAHSVHANHYHLFSKLRFGERLARVL